MELHLLITMISTIIVGLTFNSMFESWLFSVGSYVTFQFWWLVSLVYKFDVDINLFVNPGDKAISNVRY